MAIKVIKHNCKDSEITDESVFLNRRTILKQLGFLGGTSLLASSPFSSPSENLLLGKEIDSPVSLNFKKAEPILDELTQEKKLFRIITFTSLVAKNINQQSYQKISGLNRGV